MMSMVVMICVISLSKVVLKLPVMLQLNCHLPVGVGLQRLLAIAVLAVEGGVGANVGFPGIRCGHDPAGGRANRIGRLERGQNDGRMSGFPATSASFVQPQGLPDALNGGLWSVFILAHHARHAHRVEHGAGGASVPGAEENGMVTHVVVVVPLQLPFAKEV